MVVLKQEKMRNHLIKTSQEMGVKFCEIPLFCETRFMQYSHLTYKGFRAMWLVINRTLEILSAADDPKAVDAQKGIKLFLQTPKFILRLTFMEEISNILTILSKHYQKDDVLPFTPKQVTEKITQQLKDALATLKNMKPPNLSEELETGWIPWKRFSEAVKEISQTVTYQGSFLRVDGEGTGTRSQNTTNFSARDIIITCFRGRFF
jgi:hypothetical protein